MSKSDNQHEIARTFCFFSLSVSLNCFFFFFVFQTLGMIDYANVSFFFLDDFFLFFFFRSLSEVYLFVDLYSNLYFFSGLLLYLEGMKRRTSRCVTCKRDNSFPCLNPSIMPLAIFLVLSSNNTIYLHDSQNRKSLWSARMKG